MKTILLTGATGYLGRNLLSSLLKADYHVITLVRKDTLTTAFLGFENSLKVYLINEIDLADVFDSHQIDIIIHTATSYGRKGESLSSMVQSNLYFPLTILELALKKGIKYFINTDTALPKDLNNYTRSKKQFAEWLIAYSSQINILNLELEYFYGPNDDSSKFITYVLNELFSGKKHIDFTDATPLRDFIYIDDVLDAYLLILKNIENINGLNTISIGSGKAVILKDLIIEIQALVNCHHVKLNFGALPMRENEIICSCADISFLNSLGWEPKYTFKEGIQQTIKIQKKNDSN